MSMSYGGLYPINFQNKIMTIDIPITITNTQNVSTPAPFQQMIQFNPSSYFPFLRSDLSNIRFTDENYNPVPAWLESYSSTNAILWVNLSNGIQANQSVTIHMLIPLAGFSFDGQFWGEAPQLSPTYGQYDSGASVFSNYWNFAGTTLPSGWVSGSGITATVNNGLNISGSNDGTVYYNSFSTQSPFIIEADFYPNTPSIGTGIMAEYGQTGSDMYNGYLFWMSPTFAIYYIEESSGVSFTVISASGTASQVQQILSGVVGNGYQALYDNYELITSGTNNLFTPSQMQQIGFRINAGTDVIENAYWLRVRAYPPNGVMPSVSIGSPKIYNYGYIEYPVGMI